MGTNWAADHTAGALPSVASALGGLEGGAASYAQDEATKRAVQALREVFALPGDVSLDALLLTNGTAANALALACLAPPYGAVMCAESAHIHTTECGAPEFYTGGAKLIPVPSTPDGRMRLDELEARLRAFQATPKEPHQALPCVISVTQPTEAGACYTLAQLDRINALATSFGCRLHMDGARFANAVTSMVVSPADLTWTKGVDMLSFGTTKNGTWCCEVLVHFRYETNGAQQDVMRDARFRQKRGGLLLEKSRFLAAQLLGYLRDEAWLSAARQANETAAILGLRLKEVPGVELVQPVITNMVYVEMSRALFERATGAGHALSCTAGSATARGSPSKPENVRLRLCTNWSTTSKDVDSLLAALLGDHDAVSNETATAAAAAAVSAAAAAERAIAAAPKPPHTDLYEPRDGIVELGIVETAARDNEGEEGAARAGHSHGHGHGHDEQSAKRRKLSDAGEAEAAESESPAEGGDPARVGHTLQGLTALNRKALLWKAENPKARCRDCPRKNRKARHGAKHCLFCTLKNQGEADKLSAQHVHALCTDCQEDHIASGQSRLV